MEMKILSLFDGMACGYIAMLGARVEVDRYVAYEIDKYAIKTSSHNFPNIEHKGDVFTADFTKYEGFDWLAGGSPCTFWSIAQKNNRETEASGMGWELFQQYVRALHEAKPKYFIYENNKSMSKSIRASIDEAFGFEAVFINSALVSAQNRQRLYWVGRRNPDGTYSKVNVEQPIDRGVLLKDVLDGNAWGEACEESVRIPEYGTVDKARPLNAHYPNNCGGFEHRMFSDNPNKQQVDMIAESVVPFVEERLDRAVEKYGYLPEMWNPYNNAEITDKAPTLTTAANHTSSSTVLTYEPCQCNGRRQMSAEPCRVGALPRPNGELSTSQSRRVYSADGKSVTLSAQGGGMGGKTGLYAIPVEFDGDTPIKAISQADGKTYRVHKVENGLITIKGKQYPIKLADGYYIIRKLTVSECKRLQTVPEWYEFPVSDAQAYKMLGNGWTVEVIVHLIKACLAGNVEEPEFGEQIKFF
jgi:DNA (cytosine-5)-methyltransferase 3A